MRDLPESRVAAGTAIRSFSMASFTFTFRGSGRLCGQTTLSGWIEKKRTGGNYGSGNGSPQPYDRGSITGPGPYSGFAAMGMPCQKPPWGRLTAVNANTGDIASNKFGKVSNALSPRLIQISGKIVW